MPTFTVVKKRSVPQKIIYDISNYKSTTATSMPQLHMIAYCVTSSTILNACQQLTFLNLQKIRAHVCHGQVRYTTTACSTI
mmetsp:Transcript_95746/g.139864  ORF Transcript_95746/g.139864 Transcript_95746/m.139864 type:complete len:81 (+) Transcript_95746:135-377(+)